MVGRVDETFAIRRLLNDAEAGAGRVLVLVGEPGAGKTRLAQCAAEMAADVGITVLTGHAVDQELERTLGVVLDAFDIRLDQLIGPMAATRIVLEVGATAAAQFLFVDLMLEVLERRCSEGPVLLTIEDLHWCDQTTLAWLRAVGERIAALPLALLVTTRPLMTGSPARRTIEILEAEQLTLAPLDDAEVNSLVTATLGHPPSAELKAAVEAARGNALLILAVLADGSAAADPIASQLAEVDPGVLHALQAAAVLGSQVDPVQVALMIGAEPSDLLAVVGAATAAGVLEADHDRVRFRHEMYRSAVLATLSRPALSILHLHAARSLARSGADVLDVAEHYAHGARPGDLEAVRWMQEAAVKIVSTSPAAALRLVDVALTLVEHDPPDALMLVRVRALAGTGRVSEAELLGRSLLRDDLNGSADASLRRELAFTALMQGRISACVAEMQRSAELIAAPAARARAHGELAFARFMAIDHAGARADGERAVLEGLCYGDLPAQIAGDSILCMLDLFSNQVPAAVERARTITERADLTRAAEAHVFQPWFIAGLVWLETDDLTRLEATARRGRQVALQRGSGWAVPGYDGLAAFGALRSGNFDDAAATATATLSYLDGVDGLGVAVWCHSFLAQVALHRDELEEAETQLLAADRALSFDRAQLGFEQVQLARAGVLQRRGERDQALDALRLAWDGYRATGTLSPLPAMGPALCRLAHATGDRPLLVDAERVLSEAATDCGTVSVQAISVLSAAWRDTDPDLALTAATLSEQTPRLALTATALTDAADLLRHRGRRQEAERVARIAVTRWSALGAYADADACAARSRSARRTERRPRFGVPSLTATERAITALVAEGLSNAAIADTVGVSRRTVESHVSSVYRKLEVSSRVALARIALTHRIGAT